MKLLKEDTIKTAEGKWVNKGREGTHSEFKTKKAAEAQRKAMFAQGYTTEDLDRKINYGVAIWFNLKGNFDILSFKNKTEALHFANEYNLIYNKLTEENFEYIMAKLDQLIDSANTLTIYNEVYSNEIEWEEYYPDDETTIEIVDFLDYGV